MKYILLTLSLAFSLSSFAQISTVKSGDKIEASKFNEVINKVNNLKRIEERFLSSSLSGGGSGDILELQFDNLEVGGVYLISGVAAFNAKNNDTVSFDFYSGPSQSGEYYGRVRHDEGSSSTSNTNLAINIVFEAKSSSLYVFGMRDVYSSISGNGTKGSTFIQLTRLY